MTPLRRWSAEVADFETRGADDRELEARQAGQGWRLPQSIQIGAMVRCPR